MEPDDIRVSRNERENITYFLHFRNERTETVSVARDILEMARQIKNGIIIIIISNDKNDFTKGATFYGLSAYRWYNCCEFQYDKCILSMDRLRNLDGFNVR